MVLPSSGTTGPQRGPSTATPAARRWASGTELLLAAAVVVLSVGQWVGPVVAVHLGHGERAVPALALVAVALGQVLPLLVGRRHPELVLLVTAAVFAVAQVLQVPRMLADAALVVAAANVTFVATRSGRGTRPPYLRYGALGAAAGTTAVLVAVAPLPRPVQAAVVLLAPLLLVGVPAAAGAWVGRLGRPPDGPVAAERATADPVGPGPVEVPRRSPLLERLTARETEVLALLARGMTNREIADELFVGTETVKTHVGNLLAKLGVRDRVQAALFAHAQGLDRPPTAGAPQELRERRTSPTRGSTPTASDSGPLAPSPRSG